MFFKYLMQSLESRVVYSFTYDGLSKRQSRKPDISTPSLLWLGGGPFSSTVFGKRACTTLDSWKLPLLRGSSVDCTSNTHQTSTLEDPPGGQGPDRLPLPKFRAFKHL